MKKITNHKRVLVTGGAGFLGSHFCERLVADGCDVLCADNFFSGTKDNIAHLIGNPRFELLRHDVTIPLYVEVDEIYNLAAPRPPSITSTIPSRPRKPAYTARSTCWAWRSEPKRKFFRHPRAKSMATPPSIPRRRTTGATSTPSACAPATTKASAAPRRFSSTIVASTRSGSRSRAFSTRTALACTRTTGAWCPI